MGTITKDLIGKEDISWKESGTVLDTFTRLDSDGRTLTLESIDAAHLQFRTVAKQVDDLVDGGYDVSVKSADIITKSPWGDVRAYEATFDGVADDTAEIQAAIDDSSVGDVIYFPAGTGLISARIVFKPGRTYVGNHHNGTIIKQADNSNISDGMFVSEGYTTSSASPDDRVIFRDLFIDGNKANNATASTVGILATNYYSILENVTVYQTKGDGIKFDTTYVTSAGVGNKILSCKVLEVDGTGIDMGVYYTDGIIHDTDVGSVAEYGIYVKAAGWTVTENNVYDTGFDGILVSVGWNTIINDNRVDGWGQSATTTGTYVAIWLDGMTDDLPNVVNGNTAHIKAADIVAGTTYVGIKLNGLAANTSGQGVSSANSIFIDSTATSREAFHIGGNGGGTVLLTDNQVAGISASKNIVDNGGTWIIQHKNNSFDLVFQTLDGSGTATVLQGSNFKTSATNIVYSNFTDGFEGQEIFILFDFAAGDAGKVDFSGTNLKGNSNIDWFFAQYDAMRCVYDGTNWNCVPYKTATDTFTNFDQNDATPSVLRGTGVNFKTNNTVPTTITNFDNGFQGQIIFILINDANTTVDFSASNLKGNGGVDWTAASGDTMRCRYDGTNWYCDIVSDTNSVAAVSRSLSNSSNISEALSSTLSNSTQLSGLTSRVDSYHP
jgi:hypothetical protein